MQNPIDNLFFYKGIVKRSSFPLVLIEIPYNVQTAPNQTP